LKDRLAELAKHLSAKRAVLGWGFLIRSPLLVFFTVITFAGDPAYEFEHVLIASLLCAAVELVVLSVARPFVTRVSNKTVWPVWFAYWLAGELGGLLLIINLQVPFIQPGAGVSAGVILGTSGFLAIIWLTATNLTTELLTKDLQALRELKRETITLDRLTREANSRLETEVSELKRHISERVLEILEQINTQVQVLNPNTSKSQLLSSARQVQRVCESEVRSLGHSVASQKFDLLVEPATLPKMLNPWGERKARAQDILLRWEWVAAIGLPNAVTLSLQRGGWLTASISLLLMAAGILAIKQLDNWRIRALSTKSPALVLILVASEYLFMSAAAMFGLWVVGLFEVEVAHFVQAVYLTVPTVLLIIWLLVQVIQDSARRLRVFGAELSEKRELLARALEELEAKSNRARRSLGQLLHGSIQGRLASVSMALTVAAKSDSADQQEELLMQIRKQLDLSALEVSQVVQGVESPKTFDFEEEVQELKEGWKNVVNLKINISEAALEHLQVDREQSEWVIEAMRECITNAVRHGEARKIVVELGISTDLVLTVRNDGLRIEKMTPGFGIRSISNQVQRLDFHHVDGWSEVSMIWAVSRH
jgi:signal transduction histidine kinase